MNILKKSLIALIFVLGIGALLSFFSSLVGAQGTPLTMTHTADRGSAQPGETINYTVTVTNISASVVTNMFLMSPITNATYVQGSGMGTKTNPARTVALPDTWYSTGLNNFGTLNPAGVMTLTYKAIVNSGAADGSIVSSAAQVRWEGNPTGFNTEAQVLIKNKVSLCAFKTADRTQTKPGEVIEYTINICNDGNVVIHDILVVDDLPNGPSNRLVSYVSGSTTLTVGNQIMAVNDDWMVKPTHINIGNLNPGEKALVKFKVRVNDNVTDGTILENVGQVKSTETPNWRQCANQIKVVVPPIGAPQIVTAQVQPTLSVKKFVIWNNQEWEGGVAADKHKFAPGEEVTYRIRVFNNTEARAKDVKAEDRLQEPFNLEFVRSSPKEDSWNNSNKILSVTLGDMVPKSEKVWEFVFKVRSGIETNKDIDQKDVVVVTSSNAGEARSEAKVILFAPTAPVAPARKVARPAELPRAGAETGATLLVLGLGPLGLVLRRFKLI